MSDRYNIEAVQGSSLLLSITCRDNNSNYINFSGYNVRGYVREKYSSTGILLNLNPTIHTSYISGLINISGYSEDLAAIPVGQYVYDIEAYTNSYVFKPIKGYFSLYPQATY